jgi:hypothetical protein
LPDQYDLGLSTFIEPVFKTCSPDNISVQVTLINNGSIVHDFTTDPITLHLNVKSQSGVVSPYDTVISVVSGKLDLFKSEEYTFSNMVDVSIADDYYLTAWITNRLDTLPLNDTIRKTYSTIKIQLPVDENFSNGIPPEFYVKGNTSSQWIPVTEGIDADTVVKPVFGTSMLMFSGNIGAITELITGKLELQGITSPKLEFWYFHDTVYADDYLDVNITLDGENYITALSLLKQDATYGWKSYEVDLSPYANESCVNIIFESMSLSRSSVAQYIDRIRITAQQDIAVTGILTDYSACALQNKELKVVLSNLTYLILNYSMNPTDVILEIEGTSFTFTKSLQTDLLLGFASDTITMTSNFNFAPGTYRLKAYFTAKLDENPLNDTLVTTININPALSVRIHPESGETVNCLTGGFAVSQTISIYNTGNMDVSNIGLILQIDTGEIVNALYTTLNETYMGTISAGDSVLYSFMNPYIVPRNATYYIRAIAYLLCDSSMVNSTTAITECADIHNLSMVSIDNPPTNQTDVIGSTTNIVVSVQNESDNRRFSNVAITALIEDENGIMLSSCLGNISNIEPSRTEQFTIAESYTIPNEAVYFIKVYLTAQDNYPEDDTLIIRRETNVGISSIGENNVFTLGQNIPNPAGNSTRIDYSIPETGEVVFHVHSVSGQLLYSQTIESPSGKQSLEVNTNTLAAGIYFYSIEYKGQRLVKRMSIQK